jgi:hypothetical protein
MGLDAESASEGRYADFVDTVRLWLDTAVARPDLRPGIVSAFVTAADDDLVWRGTMVEFVREWARANAGRQGVKEDILIRLLDPQWQRLLLMLWVRLRAVTTGR